VRGDLQVQVEQHQDPAQIGHVRITMDAGNMGPVFVAVNTLSKHNRDAGFLFKFCGQA
jgi:hypothetical protein